MVWLKQSKFISMCTHRGLKERQFIAHYPLALSTFKPQSLLRDYQGVLSLNYLISSELPFELCQSKLIGILSNKKSCSKAVYRPLSSPAAIVVAAAFKASSEICPTAPLNLLYSHQVWVKLSLLLQDVCIFNQGQMDHPKVISRMYASRCGHGRFNVIRLLTDMYSSC